MMGWKSISIIVVFLFLIGILIFLPEPQEIEGRYLPTYTEQTMVDEPVNETNITIIDDTIEDEPIIPEKIVEKGPKTHFVTIKRKLLVPNVSTINAGDSITWLVDDDRVHKIASKNWDLRSGQLYEGDNYSFTFDEKGVYWYLDAVFGVWGKVIVR